MNLIFLKKLSKKNPALARLIESAILAGLIYITSSLYTGVILDERALIQAVAGSLALSFQKYKRNLSKDINEK